MNKKDIKTAIQDMFTNRINTIDEDITFFIEENRFQAEDAKYIYAQANRIKERLFAIISNLRLETNTLSNAKSNNREMKNSLESIKAIVDNTLRKG